MTRTLIVAALAAIASTASAQAVPVTLAEFKITMGRDTVQAGAVTFKVKNIGKMSHALWVLGEGVDKGTKDVAAGQEQPLTLNLKPGKYEIFCPMAEMSHKMAGMTRTLVVLPAEKPAATKKP